MSRRFGAHRQLSLPSLGPMGARLCGGFRIPRIAPIPGYWKRLHAAAIVGVVVVVTLLVLPSVSATPQAGVTMRKPYGGNVLTSSNSTGTSHCSGTGSKFTTAPFFSLIRGRGGAGQYSNSEPCQASVANYQEAVSSFGFTSAVFTPNTTVASDHIKVRWTLNYDVFLTTTFIGGSQNISWAAATVMVTSDVRDVNSGRNVDAGNPYYNYSSTNAKNGTISFTVTSAMFTLLMVRNLEAGHSYEISTWVTCTTQAETLAPVGSGDAARSQITFQSDPAGGILDMVSY
jgi:hypothetical protein